MNQVSIVIVYYKCFELLRECLTSIYKETVGLEFEVIVVDNASCDQAGVRILEQFPKVKWMDMGYNSGYARGNNAGIKSATGDFILILNPDTIILDQAITKSIHKLRELPDRIAVLGPKLIYPDGTLQKSYYFSYNNLSEFISDNKLVSFFQNKHNIGSQNKKVKALMGSFLLIRKKAIRDVTGFDPDFFMYSEECELFNRLAEQNYDLIYYPEVTVVHHYGGTQQNDSWNWHQRILSQGLMMKKTRGNMIYAMMLLIRLLNILTDLLLSLIGKVSFQNAWANCKLYLRMTPLLLQIFTYTRKTGGQINPVKYQ